MMVKSPLKIPTSTILMPALRTHYEDIGYFGAAKSANFSLLIQNNTLINQNISNRFSDLSKTILARSIMSRLITNILVGGDYHDLCKRGGRQLSVTNVSITNNHLGTGIYGYTDFAKTSAVFTGNVNDGATLVAAAGFPIADRVISFGDCGQLQHRQHAPPDALYGRGGDGQWHADAGLNDGGTRPIRAAPAPMR